MNTEVDLMKTGKENLDIVLFFLTETNVNELFNLEPDQAKHLWRLINSPRATQATDSPESLFPEEAFASYRDHYGNVLRGGRRPYCRYRKDGVIKSAECMRLRQKEILVNQTLPHCRKKLADMLFSRRVLQGNCYQLLTTPRKTKHFFAEIVMPELASEFEVDVTRTEACIAQILA